VPTGGRRLLVTCPSCKYKFLLNTEFEGTAREAEQRVPRKFEWKSRVIYPTAASFFLALLIVGSVAVRGYLRAGSALENATSLWDSLRRPLSPSKTINDACMPVEQRSRISPQDSGQTFSSSVLSTAAPPESSIRKNKLLVVSDADFEHDQPLGTTNRSLPTRKLRGRTARQPGTDER
jgi:hypothetical protein